VFYGIKCVIDDLLDLTENITDGELNALLAGSFNQMLSITVSSVTTLCDGGFLGLSDNYCGLLGLHII
jgi:hypothetical protein